MIRKKKKNGFIDSEAIYIDGEVHSESFNENKCSDEIDDSIDNTPQPDKNNVSFYRQINNRFLKQTKNPQNAIFEQDCLLCETGDLQPELYDPVSRNLVVFDRFEGSEKHVERFKKDLEKVWR